MKYNKLLFPIIVFINTFTMLFPDFYKNTIFECFRYIAYILMIIILVFNLLIMLKSKTKAFKFSKFICLFVLFFTILFVISFVNKTDYATFDKLVYYFSFVFFFVFLDISFYYNLKGTLKALFIPIFIFCIWDIYVIIAYPNGLYSERADFFLDVNKAQWLYGNKNNQTIIFILFTFMATWLKKFMQSTFLEVTTIITIIFIIIASIILNSSTNFIIVLLILLAILGAPLFDKFTDSIVYKRALEIYYFINILLISNSILFLKNIVSIFGKDLTFSGRTHVWNKTINLIKDRILFGYGNIEGAVSQKLINTINPHNTVLTVLLYGGIILFIVYHCCLKMINNSISKIKNHNDKFFAFFFLVIVFIRSLFEQMSTNLNVWLILYLIYCFSYFSNIKEA